MIYSILPNTVGIVIDLNEYGFTNIIWFITIYLIGAYFRLYSFWLLRHTSISVILLFVFLGIMLSARTYQLNLGDNVEGINVKIIGALSLLNTNALMPFAISALMFCSLCLVKFKGNKMFFSFSKATFGVYLIHANPLFDHYLFQNILHTRQMYESQWFVFLSIFLILTLYATCTMIEMIREKYIEKPFFSSNKICRVISKIDNRIT